MRQDPSADEGWSRQYMPTPMKLPFRLLILWGCLFITAFSLGYPTLNRYDPTTTALADTQYYLRMVEGDLTAVPDSHWRYRVLTPLLARPFAKWSQGHIGSWHSGFFGLLVVNAFFCASTGLLLTAFALRLFGEARIGLLAGLLYLTDFNVSNLYLAGLVDAAEVFFLVALAWTLFNRRWWLVPLIAIGGALAKETFVPFACILFAGWYLAEKWYRGQGGVPTLSGILLGLVGLGTVTAVRFAISGHLEMPWETASTEIVSISSMLVDLPSTLFNRSAFYAFVIVAPLGLLGIRHMPRGWVAGSTLAFFSALVLGAGAGAGDNIGRPLFSTAGPILCLSAAGFLWRFLRPETPRP